MEVNGTTTLVNVASVSIVKNASIPLALEISTGDLSVNCTYQGEQYEGMLIAIRNATILSEVDEWGQIALADAGADSQTELEDRILDTTDHLTSVFGTVLTGSVLTLVRGIPDLRRLGAPAHQSHVNPHGAQKANCYIICVGDRPSVCGLIFLFESGRPTVCEPVLVYILSAD